MSESPKEQLNRLEALWRQERRATRARVIEVRRQTTLKERVARGIALTDLSIDDIDAAPGGRVLVWLKTGAPGGMEDVRVGPGSPVRLWWDDPDADDVVLATVARRRGDRLAVMLDDDPPPELDEGGFKLDRDDPEATFKRGLAALDRFREAERGSDMARLRDVLFADRAPSFESPPVITIMDGALNEPQREAVARAVAAEDLALILGPPGTGKTRTLVEVIRQAIDRGERVLAAAASNAAVDNLAERLLSEHVRVVRLGHPARITDAMEPSSLDALLERTNAYKLARRWVAEAAELRRKIAKRWAKRSISREERRELYREARRLTSDARRHLRAAQSQIIGSAQVVCATAAGADAALLSDEHFDLLVLDEATQAPDPIALVPVARASRVVMAGDPHQLPPTVLDLDAARGGLSETFFERLNVEYTQATSMLTIQHRMHADIMAFPSRSKYEGRLVAAPEVADHQLHELPGVDEDPMRPSPLIFLDVSGKGWQDTRTEADPSTSNPQQAERVAAEVHRLLERGLPTQDLAVITPYLAQVRLLRDLLRETVQRGLEIDTIDGFQGREKEAIIVDLVRSNDEGALGFLKDTRRMNVALTRARRALMVVGDSATLGGHPYYADFMDAVESHGFWLSAWA